MSVNEQQSDSYASMKVHATTSTSEAVAGNGDGEDRTGKPKRPLSAYNLFFRDQRTLLLEELPSREGQKPKRSHGKINFKDLANTIAAKWKEILPSEKEKYEKIASVGREKYVKIAKEWKRKQKQLKKEREKKEKAEVKAASKKSPPRQEARQDHMIQFASTHASPVVASSSDMMMSERLVTPRTSQWHSQYSASVPLRRHHDFVTEENPLQHTPQLRTELGMGHGIFAPPPAPMSQPVAAFEDDELVDVPAPFSFNDQQQYRQPQPMMTTSSGSFPSARAFSFREQTQRSMSLPRMSTTDTAGDYLHPMGTPQMFHSQPLPFSPSLNMRSVPQSQMNSTWNNSVEPTEMHQPLPLSSGLSFHTPMRTHSLPCRLPTDLLPVSLNTAPPSFHRDFRFTNPEPIQQQPFHDLMGTEPLPFDFPNEGSSHHHASYHHQQQPQYSSDNIVNINNGFADNMDLFTESFDEANDM